MKEDLMTVLNREPDAAPTALSAAHAPSNVLFCAGGTKGNVLILTEDLTLVLSLRMDLMRAGYNLTWTNNFWIALSYIQGHSYAGLVLDLRVDSVEEHYVMTLIDDYRGSSRGQRVVVGDIVSPAMKTGLERRQSAIIEGAPVSGTILQALRIASPQLNIPAQPQGRLFAPAAETAQVI